MFLRQSLVHSLVNEYLWWYQDAWYECENGDKTSGSIKYGKFVNYLLNYEGVLKSKPDNFYMDMGMLTQIKPK